MGDATKSLAAEIGAILRKHRAQRLITGSEEKMEDAIPQIAAEIATLQSRAFEDGARWMRERAYSAVIDVRHAAACNFSPEFSGVQGEARTNSLATAAKAIQALPLQPEGERNA